MKNVNCVLILFIGFASLVFCSSAASAQSGKVPPFRIIQSGGKLYKAENLPMEKPILIVYFSPECDHCETFMTEFFKRTNDFKKASVAMITFLPVEKVTTFVKDYKVNNYPNIVAGTEGNSFFLRNYYKLTDIPFAALYDKGGNLICSYQKDIPLNDLAKRLQKLK